MGCRVTRPNLSAVDEALAETHLADQQRMGSKTFVRMVLLCNMVKLTGISTTDPSQ